MYLYKNIREMQENADAIRSARLSEGITMDSFCHEFTVDSLMDGIHPSVIRIYLNACVFELKHESNRIKKVLLPGNIPLLKGIESKSFRRKARVYVNGPEHHPEMERYMEVRL